jgi:hypothetical protein
MERSGDACHLTQPSAAAEREWGFDIVCLWFQFDT